MAGISAGVAVQAALTRQAIALEVLKQSADLQQKSADILLESIVNVPASGNRGANVNISA